MVFGIKHGIRCLVHRLTMRVYKVGYCVACIDILK